MVDFKLVISDPSTGKSVQREVKEPDSKRFLGLKIGNTIKGESINLTGYEFQITGGSDYSGFPMRMDVPGQGKKGILLVKGIGVYNPEKGIKVRKTVAGNTIHAQTAQINLKILKKGSEDIFPEKKEETEKKEEKPAKEKKEKAK